MPRSTLTAPSPYGGNAIVFVGTGHRDAERVLRQADADHHIFHAYLDQYGWHAYIKHQTSETVHGRKEMRKLARGFTNYFNIHDVAERWLRNGAVAELAIVVWIQESND
jgi:hypothetical protein